VVKTLTKEQLAKTIDQTLLNPLATSKDIEQLCINAKKNHFAAVCINPTFITQAKKILADTDVKVCSVVGYPLGANKSGEESPPDTCVFKIILLMISQKTNL